MTERSNTQSAAQRSPRRENAARAFHCQFFAVWAIAVLEARSFKIVALLFISSLTTGGKLNI